VTSHVCFFFKQKTAYEMLRSLVGSEMCIRDRSLTEIKTLTCCKLILFVCIAPPRQIKLGEPSQFRLSLDALRIEPKRIPHIAI